MTDSVEAKLSRGLEGHPAADPLTEAVTNRIVQIARQYESAMRDVVSRHGISLGDAEVLFTLAHSERPHQTPGELAKIFRITPGSMTTRLGRLERAGYIERRIDPNNRVNINVVLTSAGDELHHRAVDDLVRLRRRLIAQALPENDLSRLNTLLGRTLNHIEQKQTPDVPLRLQAETG